MLGQPQMFLFTVADGAMKNRRQDTHVLLKAFADRAFVILAAPPITGVEPGLDAHTDGGDTARIESKRAICCFDGFRQALRKQESAGPNRPSDCILRLGGRLREIVAFSKRSESCPAASPERHIVG